jgi:hypothetical protein
MFAAHTRRPWIVGILVTVAFASFLAYQPSRSYAVDAQQCVPGSRVMCLQIDGLEKGNPSASRYTVTNESGSYATLAHTYYPSNGDPGIIVTDAVAPNATNTYDLATISAVPEGFTGMVQISSDQPISAELLPAPVLPTPIPTPPKTYLPLLHGPSPFIASSSGLVLTSGTVEIVGEVVNPGTTPLCYATIALRFYNAADQLVATDSTSTYMSATLPGQPNPFKSVLSSAPTNIAYYQPSLSWSKCFNTYHPITVLSQQVRKRPDPEVFGEIRNDNAMTINSIDVGITYYNAAGRVVYADWDYPTPSTLAAGASGIYSARSYISNLPYASVTVRAQGYASSAAIQSGQSQSTKPAAERHTADDQVQRLLPEGATTQP